jgi:hypothetical protein
VVRRAVTAERSQTPVEPAGAALTQNSLASSGGAPALRDENRARSLRERVTLYSTGRRARSYEERLTDNSAAPTLAPRSTALPLIWLFNIVGTLDLVNAFYQGTRLDVGLHLGSAWYIPTFVVPALFVSHFMIFVLLVKRLR